MPHSTTRVGKTPVQLRWICGFWLLSALLPQCCRHCWRMRACSPAWRNLTTLTALLTKTHTYGTTPQRSVFTCTVYTQPTSMWLWGMTKAWIFSAASFSETVMSSKPRKKGKIIFATLGPSKHHNRCVSRVSWLRTWSPAHAHLYFPVRRACTGDSRKNFCLRYVS